MDTLNQLLQDVNDSGKLAYVLSKLFELNITNKVNVKNVSGVPLPSLASIRSELYGNAKRFSSGTKCIACSSLILLIRYGSSSIALARLHILVDYISEGTLDDGHIEWRGNYSVRDCAHCGGESDVKLSQFVPDILPLGLLCKTCSQCACCNRSFTVERGWCQKYVQAYMFLRKMLGKDLARLVLDLVMGPS